MASFGVRQPRGKACGAAPAVAGGANKAEKGPMQLEAATCIQLVVNGARLTARARTLAELVDELGLREGAVATALNGDFVPRAARSATALASDDKVEIVAPRQGG